MTTAVRREFLPADRLPLAGTVDYLLARYRSGPRLDLRAALIVVPGGRAGKRLLELLVERCEAERLEFHPPSIVTPGTLPEELYLPKRPFASALVQTLVWAEALRQTDRATLATVFPRLPERDDDSAWLEYAELLRGQHTSLAADGLDFSKVANALHESNQSYETKRWQALRMVQERYLARLDALELWDIQTARLVALEKHECTTDRDILLVAAVDMNRTARSMLEAVAGRVTALIFAPEAWRGRFDALGCVDSQAWQQATIDLDCRRTVRLAEGPAEQAREAARALAAFEGRYRADQITVGVPDESLIPHLQRELAQSEVASRFGLGREVSQSPPCRLLLAAAELASSRRFRKLAELARHPDLQIYLSKQNVPPEWLMELDVYYNHRLPARVDWSDLQWWKPYQPEPEGDAAPQSTLLEQAIALIERLMEPLSQGKQTLADWAEAIGEFLQTVYGDRVLDLNDPADRELGRAYRALLEALDDLRGVPNELLYPTTLDEAVKHVIDVVRAERVPAPAIENAVEMLGWLELPLDDAPALVVANMNEGVVPASWSGDLFIPHTLRKRLGMEDNERIYARDAYYLSLLAASREALTLIVGRRGADGEARFPSRLLLAADGEELVERAAYLFGETDREQPAPADGVLASAPTPVLEERFCYQPPQPLLPLARPIERMGVTWFRSYLACKYRFYLRHVLRLEAVDDAAEEMDPGAFGELLHEVMADFAQGELRRATDAKDIEALLLEQLEKRLERRFARYRLAATAVQIDQLRYRLKSLAQQQAEWAAAGWEIVHTERDRENLEVPFDVDGEAIALVGRIDRIDRHRETGQWMLLDYKTKETAESPERVHRKRSGEWIDLQLPLYRHLARCHEIEGPVGMGYIAVPKNPEEIGFSIAEWSSEDLVSADAAARDVVRGIRENIFWPWSDESGPFDDFGPLCLQGVFGVTPPMEEELEEG